MAVEEKSNALRDALLKWVLSGTDTVIAYQKFFGVTRKGPTNPIAHRIFVMGAAFGNELFFITFLPLLFWLYDVNVARATAQQWVICFYIGQFWKDTTRLPRPPADRVVRLEKHYEHEYGMPSTHCSNGVCMPWYIVWLSWSRFAWGPRWILLACAAYWTITCIASRMYMGVHSPADVVMGTLLGCGLLSYSITFGATVDNWLQTDPNVYWILPLAYVILAAVYPRPKRPYWLNSPGDTALILGASTGVQLSCKFLGTAQAAAANRMITGPGSLQELVAMIPWIALGLVAIIATRSVFKGACFAVAKAILPPIFGPADDPSLNGEGIPFAGPGAKEQKPAGDNDVVNKGEDNVPASPVGTGGNNNGLRVDTSAPPNDSASALDDRQRSNDTTGSNGNPTAVSRASARAPLPSPSTASGAASATARDPLPVSPSDSPLAAVTPASLSSSGSDAANSTVAQAGMPKVASEAGFSPATGSNDSGLRRRPVTQAAEATAPAASTGGSGAGTKGGLMEDGKGSSSEDGPGFVLVPLGKRYDVELPTKMITYAAVGVATIYVVPHMLQWAGVAKYGY